MTRILLPTLILMCALGAACTHRNAPIASAGVPEPSLDNGFTDLHAGGRLRIVVPLLNGTDKHLETGEARQNGGTIILSAGNLIGYQTSYYFVNARSHERVQLSFIAAQTTKDGVTMPAEQAPKLPFALPSGSRHIRLIYYIRQSESDHNMAIAAAKDPRVLDSFTARLQHEPSACSQAADVFCAWVPQGVAVRPD